MHLGSYACLLLKMLRWCVQLGATWFAQLAEMYVAQSYSMVQALGQRETPKAWLKDAFKRAFVLGLPILLMSVDIFTSKVESCSALSVCNKMKTKSYSTFYSWFVSVWISELQSISLGIQIQYLGHRFIYAAHMVMGDEWPCSSFFDEVCNVNIRTTLFSKFIYIINIIFLFFSLYK